jgi:HK97 family phage prohead protease
MIGNDGTFTGYAYVFGVVAKGHNEMIVPGAFTATIDQWKAKAESGGANVPVLRNHNDAQPIGVIEDMLQDDKGLWVRGKLVLGTDDADEVQKLSDAGALGGMSIGFVANKTEKIGDITHLSEVDLHEVSFVVFPAIETAMVDGMINLYDAMVLDESVKPAAMSCGTASMFASRSFSWTAILLPWWRVVKPKNSPWATVPT